MTTLKNSLPTSVYRTALKHLLSRKHSEAWGIWGGLAGILGATYLPDAVLAPDTKGTLANIGTIGVVAGAMRVLKKLNGGEVAGS